MRLLAILQLRLRSIFRRAQVEGELDEELRYHLERLINENMAAGMSRRDASFAALRSMGGMEQRKEECRDMRGLNPLDHFTNDLRFAVRQLRKSPGFAGATILMLALGICSSVAIFAFVDAALLKPLPYRNSERLLGVYERIDPWCLRCNISWPDFLDWRSQNSTLASLDVFQGGGYAMLRRDRTTPVHGARVSDGFFRTLGVTPFLGRDFYAAEDQPTAARTVILSYPMWQTQFGGQRDVLGQTVVLDRIPRTIVGVLPKEFHFAPAGPADFWLPFHPETRCDLRRSCHSLYGVGRLRDGVTANAALSNLVSIAKALEQLHPDSNRNQGANIAALSDVITGDIRPVLLVLMGGAGLLLLIATVNVAGLLLVRSEKRKREFAVRMALGASSGRLLGHFAAEAMVLVAAGVSLGLAASHWTIRLLTHLLSEDMLARMPFLGGIGWNWRLGGFGFAVSALSVAIFAIAPSLRVRLPEVREGLAEGARGSGGVWRNLGAKLVVVELATAVVLLVGAGLLTKSLNNLLHVKLGLQPDHLAMIDVAAPNASYAGLPRSTALARTVLERAAGIPGVRSASVAANGAPLSHNGNTNWIRILGRPWNGEHIDVPERDVSPAWFRTIGAKLTAGRYFDESDDSSKPQVAIVNQAFARKHFPDEDPIGKRIGQASAAPVPVEIVGVIEDVREGPLNDEIPPVVYRPYSQDFDTYFTLAVRTSQSEGSVLPALGRIIREIDPEIVPVGGMTMTERIDQSASAWIQRSTAWLTSGFAALALVLALVGLYGVIAYSVSQRTREIGVRMAMGAESRTVRWMILREAARLSAIGIAAGLVCSAFAASFLGKLLFSVSPWDPATMGAIAVVLAATSLIASLIPARRAAMVDPVEALRAE
jgi:predicted permease